MKICISAFGKDPDSEVDPQFGRCNYFVIIDPEIGSVTSIKNPGSEASGGAGIRAAEEIASAGVDTLLTGSVGPNSFSILSEAGIEIHSGIRGTVSFALREYQSGKLSLLESPNASTHIGMRKS
ncbi:dinitrogenase iron-molybdenum cofactor biosynthesis protein [Methanosarcina sp. 1.H.T.1A.1]|uniref:NifB/NifX family molybdenum-iron cluster-binding protein n=1 Tax=unclassified Methanosarcina TaxID=2644672 RepID=UPI000621C705|nr:MULTISPECIES: NifB/NifX family molybdenum-iron cluster-binding protein [unclassified Methanosarcina]KKH50633.1 dinitrogenase iron-molybdenum cofactor biosynthesis protein [Methanosarcina sp. 1.H.A.2.2]KKH99795.1 dinitrogenase iron-molybdenum cofactor biosynthesis protein [Methanosarcina sp. 1.H.T.1A.1]